ncbi:uncharacterized protein LOC143549309 [Bidens hawaiensis]|uniref:uncharacterized protein LOC143549309 n=1 Tax=Bidens hawaiensis TaxID=980011 RepID=UPI00404A3C52
MAKNETFCEFAGKITSMVSKATSLGHVFEQDVLVKKLLDAVPDKYFKLVASIEQSVEIDSMMFEDVVGRLKAFEERLRGRERASNSQRQLLFNRSESNYKGKSYDQSGSQGKGWPISQGRGRGRDTGGQARDIEDQHGCENRGGQGRGPSQTVQRRTNDRQRGRKDRSHVQCCRCDEFGHLAYMCPEHMKKKVESNLNKIDVHFVYHKRLSENSFLKGDQKTVFLNEDGVIPKRFETKPMEKEGKVKFGDESCIDIQGKGSVLVEWKTGEQRLLTDVYYIPFLQCNIISGQATKGGCDIHMKHDFLTVKDDTCKLLMKVTRTKNLLYNIGLMITSLGK